MVKGIPIQTAAVTTVTGTTIASSAPAYGKDSTSAAKEATLGKTITDIITGQKLGDSAVVEWFDFRAHKSLYPKDKRVKQTRSSHESKETLHANWTLKGNEDSFIVTTGSKTSWRRKLPQPSIVAVNASGVCRNVTLVSVDSSTYVLKLNAEELDGGGVLIMGDTLNDGYLLQRHTIKRLGLSPEDLQLSSNLTKQAVQNMKRLQRDRTSKASTMSHLYQELQVAMSGVRSRMGQIVGEAGGPAETARKHLRSWTDTEEWTSSFDDWSQSYRENIPDAKQMQKAIYSSLPALSKRPDGLKAAAKVVQDQSRSAAGKLQHDTFDAVKKASKRAREVSDRLQGASHRIHTAIGGTVDRAAGARAWMARMGA